MIFERFKNNPLITPQTHPTLGTNINGPSVIKVPQWIKNPMGRYYMYFAAHKGTFIRLAYADSLDGEWKIYEKGTLQLADSFFTHHIASPDVHVDEDNRQIVMFFHGQSELKKNNQFTRVAYSDDGISFYANAQNLTTSYWRGFWWNNHFYAITMEGKVFRSDTLRGAYEEGPNIFADLGVWQRHMAVYLKDDQLYVFFSIKESTPEHIVVSLLDLSEDWHNWRLKSYQSVVLPQEAYEGADLPLETSQSGQVTVRAHQLRDPAIYVEDDIYLFYSIAGESGIAGGRLYL